MVSDNLDATDDDGAFVLILVLMEYGLWLAMLEFADEKAVKS